MMVYARFHPLICGSFFIFQSDLSARDIESEYLKCVNVKQCRVVAQYEQRLILTTEVCHTSQSLRDRKVSDV
jgi:hypothetical protein